MMKDSRTKNTRYSVYKEDFNKFLGALNNTVNPKTELMPDVDFTQFDPRARRNEEITLDADSQNKSSVDSELKWD